MVDLAEPSSRQMPEVLLCVYMCVCVGARVCMCVRACLRTLFENVYSIYVRIAGAEIKLLSTALMIFSYLRSPSFSSLKLLFLQCVGAAPRLWELSAVGRLTRYPLTHVGLWGRSNPFGAKARVEEK